MENMDKLYEIEQNYLLNDSSKELLTDTLENVFALTKNIHAVENIKPEKFFNAYIVVERLQQLMEFEMHVKSTIEKCLELTEFTNIETIQSGNNTSNHNDLGNYSNTDSNKYLKCKRANYSKEVSKILRNWLKENLNNSYPSEREKNDLIKMTGLNSTQINNWFINARRRILPYMKSKLVNYDE